MYQCPRCGAVMNGSFIPEYGNWQYVYRCPSCGYSSADEVVTMSDRTEWDSERASVSSGTDASAKRSEASSVSR